MTEAENIIAEYQREYFAILQEFFERATGCNNCEEFSTIDGFADTIHQKAPQLAERAGDAYAWGYQNISDFLAANASRSFNAAKELGGLKLVSGGSGYFTGTHLNSVRKTLLYADTVLVPDPVSQWVEVERSEEKFRNVKFLQSVFILLHLKPLVDADLSVPAIAVFPSWEKLLDEKDEFTVQQQLQLITDVVAFHSKQDIESFDDVRRFVYDDPNKFLEVVSNNQLFVAPGGNVGDPISLAISQYRDDIATWRTPEHVKKIESLGEAGMVLNGIGERLNPQFHLMENSSELNSQPLLSLPVHAHYYRICSKLFEQRLERLSFVNPETIATIEALNSERLHWLGNIPFDSLAVLRQNDENIEFRQQLQSHLAHLHESALSDTDRVVSEVTKGISTLMRKHQGQLSGIEEKYSRLHTKTAIGSWVTLAATFVPSLAPFLGIAAPFALAAKYGSDKASELKDKNAASKSLMGILVEAESSENK